TPVGADRTQERAALSDRRLRREQPDLHQLSQLRAHFNDARISVALDLAQRLSLHVVEDEAVILEPLLELVALRALLDDSVGDGLDAGVQPLLRTIARFDHHMRDQRGGGKAVFFYS